MLVLQSEIDATIRLIRLESAALAKSMARMDSILSSMEAPVNDFDPDGYNAVMEEAYRIERANHIRRNPSTRKALNR